MWKEKFCFGYLIMMFLNIFFVYFRLENEVQLLKEKIKAKEECGV